MHVFINQLLFVAHLLLAIVHNHSIETKETVLFSRRTIITRNYVFMSNIIIFLKKIINMKVGTEKTVQNNISTYLHLSGINLDTVFFSS